MKNKKIGLMLLMAFSFIQANSQNTYFRSDTNLIKMSGSTMTAQPSSAGTDSIYFEDLNFGYLQSGDTLVFNHRITNSSGNLQRLVIQLVDQSGNKINLHRNVYSGSSSTFQTLPVLINSNGYYKIRFSFFRDGGNSTQKFEINGITVNSIPVVLDFQEKKPKTKPKAAPEDEEIIQIFDFFYGRMIFEGEFKEFVKNHAENGKIYFTSGGYKFIKE